MNLKLGSQSAKDLVQDVPVVLLVEDNPADVRLMQEVVSDLKVPCELIVAYDGEQAMQAMRSEGDYSSNARPNLVLLDLNLPKKDGREVLSEIKTDEQLRQTPVVVLTTSRAEQDISATYQLNANCYLNKPMDLDEYINTVRLISEYWLQLAQLPPPRLGAG